MAATPNTRARAIEQGIAILSEAFEHEADLKEYSQRLDESAVSALELVIEAIIKGDQLVWDVVPHFMEDYDGFELAMDAAELLAHKSSTTSIPLIMRLFREMAVEGIEFLAASGPDLVCDFPPEAAAAWLRNVRPTKGSCSVESVILDGIGLMAEENVSIQQELAPLVVQLLTCADRSSPELNGQLVRLAYSWKLTEAAETIERAFSRNFVDCGVIGNWETVRQQLGVEGLGLSMPMKPINSMEDFRRRMGIGVFSDVPLFGHDELDESACHAYLMNVLKAFQEFARDAGSTDPDCGSFTFTFLQLGLNYLGVHAETMTVESARKILFDLFPRQVSQAAEKSDRTIDELVAFWTYCDRVHQMEPAAILAKRINSWRDKFREAMSDPANFGMAKSLFMSGIEAGFDMTNKADIAAFIQLYNQSRSAPSGRREAASSSNLSPLTATSSYAAVRSDPPITKDLKQRKKLLKKLKRK